MNDSNKPMFNENQPTFNAGCQSIREGVPVMPCHPAEEGGVPRQLARGSTPSTREGDSRQCNRRHESRRMSVKKFFRCTPQEDAVIKANAARVGLEVSAYMRVQSTGVPIMKAYRQVRADWKELQRCLGAINKAGSVVNQLVKVLYLGGVRSDIGNDVLEELRKAARAVMAALGRG